MLWAAGFTVVGAMTLVALAVDESEEKVSLDQLPPAVKATILEEAKGGAIEQIGREREGDKTVYEAEWTVGGQKHDAKVSAEGALIELEEDVSPEDVPAAVRAVAAKKFPANAQVEYERKMIVLYELEAEIDGREIELLVGPTGHVYERDEEDEDGDEDDD
jgi:hypothetical protein